MSREQSRTIETQQSTIRNLYATVEHQRIAMGDALTMLRAGHYEQAIADLQRGIGEAKRGRVI